MGVNVSGTTLNMGPCQFSYGAALSMYKMVCWILLAAANIEKTRTHVVLWPGANLEFRSTISDVNRQQRRRRRL